MCALTLGHGVEVSLTLITGIQAAGKSTIAQALAERLARSVHVRGDTFRRMIVNCRAEMGPATPSEEAVLQLHLRYVLAVGVADGYAEAGFDVVLQDVILGSDLRWVVERVRTRPFFVVVLAPSPGAVESRDRERQRSGKVAYRSGELGIEELDATLRGNTPRLGLWLDTSDLTVDDIVNVILDRLGPHALISR